MKTIIFILLFFFQTNYALAQSNKIAKAAPNAVGSAGNTAIVNETTYMWTIGEAVVFTGLNASGFITQGFHQPMICKAYPVIVALNQTSCLLPYSLSVVQGFDKYVWKIGKSTIANAAGATYYPVEDGKHSVTVMDSTGCMLTAADVIVDLSGKNIIPVITAFGSASNDTLLQSTVASTYQWYVITPSDGVHRAIVGEVNREYRPLFNGTYYVKINTEEQCISYSTYYTVNNSGYEPISKYDFEHSDSTIKIIKRHKFMSRNLKVYPIPSRDKLTIDYESPENNMVTFNIYDIKGVLVDTKKVKNQEGKLLFIYENSSLAIGKYTLQVLDGDKISDKGIIFE